MREVCFALICFLTKAAEEKIDIPLLGPGGIIVDFKENKDVTFLFLPQDLYKYSVGTIAMRTPTMPPRLKIGNGIVSVRMRRR